MTRKNLKSSFLATSGLISALAFLGAGVLPATAASTDNANAKQASYDQIDVITVTATRRTVDMQSVPVAVTALTAAALQAKGISTVDDLKFAVPGLQIYQESPGITNYTIRGLGNENNRSANADGSVGLFLNDVYIGRPYLLNTGFLDVERIEVLRGPQGALFGRNTIGGAISFYNTKPSDELHMAGEVTVGNYNTRNFSGYVSGPLTSNLFAKIAVTTKHHDGYDFNQTTNTAVNNENFNGLSAALRYMPNENLDITLNLDTSISRGLGTWWIVYERGPYSGAPYANPHSGNAADDNGFGNINNTGGSLNIDWTTPIGKVTSITSYRHGKLDSRSPTTGTMPDTSVYYPTPDSDLSNILFTQEDDYHTTQYSQELRLASDNNSNLSWIVGAFYYHEKSSHLEMVDFLFNNYYGYSGTSRYDSGGATDSYALFGTAAYNFTSALKLQVGLRQTWDKKSSHESPSGSSYQAGFQAGGEDVDTFYAEGSKNFSSLTPSFTLSYQMTPSAYAYATVSKGYKSGGFNDTLDIKESAETPYNEEKVWNYEVGMKSEFFDRHVRLNVSAFRLNYTNLQINQVIPNPSFPDGPPIVVTANAGKTHNQGVEVELEARPVRGLDIYGNYSWSKSRVDDLSVEGVSLTGNQLPLVPKVKMMFGAAYTLPVETVDVTLRGSYSRTSSYYGYIDNDPMSQVPPQSTVNASLMFAPQNSAWTFKIWGKNLSNNLNVSQLFPIFGASYGLVGAPRTYGVSLHYQL